MKNYKQILEAVRRGIQMALDDYQDIEPNSSVSQTNDVINTEDVIQKQIDLMKETVDLGLPSKTLWCKYNLDVDPNQLSKPEDWCGKCYAWGELEGNKRDEYGWVTFQWSNYKFGEEFKLTKYCDNPRFGLNGFTDNLIELLPEDDVAYQNKKLHNYKFHIPTKEQIDELLKYTTNYWVNNYDPNKTIHDPKDDGGIQGLNGRIFEGKNRNQLFIPAAGFCYSSIKHWEWGGSKCFMWSSSLKLDFPAKAHYLYFDSDDISMYGERRSTAAVIRPVIYKIIK